MYPVYETDRSVRSEIEFVAQLEELRGRMNPLSYGPTEPHLWLVGRIPPSTWENCRETFVRKAVLDMQWSGNCVFVQGMVHIVLNCMRDRASDED